MQLTFFEVLGDPLGDGECTALRSGVGQVTLGEDTLLNRAPGVLPISLNGTEYRLDTGPGAILSGLVNPGTRHLREVAFARLIRTDGAPSQPRIVVFSGTLSRGEALVDITAAGPGHAGDHHATICFTPGTRILTAFGDVPVEALRIGDLIHTADNGLQPLRWIGQRELSAGRQHAAPLSRPVTIRAGALGHGLPDRTIRVSPAHCMLIGANKRPGVLAPAAALIDDRTVLVEPTVTDTVYFHLLFDEHQIIYADGAPTESFYPCPAALMSLCAPGWDELLRLLPYLRDHPFAYGPRARATLRPGEAKLLLAA